MTELPPNGAMRAPQYPPDPPHSDCLSAIDRVIDLAEEWAAHDPRAEPIVYGLGSLAVEARQIRGHPDGV